MYSEMKFQFDPTKTESFSIDPIVKIDKFDNVITKVGEFYYGVLCGFFLLLSDPAELLFQTSNIVDAYHASFSSKRKLKKFLPKSLI